MPDMTETRDLGERRRVAFLGGIYSNYLSLRSALELSRAVAVDAVVSLGDLGAFGPHPDRAIEIVRGAGIAVIRGNYEESLATDAPDCRCGYTDPRDNYYARISYEYTRERTSTEHKLWMGTLPAHGRMTMGGRRLLLCHGSPRRVNEFLFSSTTPVPFIERLLREHRADVILCTHTGIHWSRFTEPGRGVVNVGALGRPANDGRTNVWLTVLEEAGSGGIDLQFIPVDYDHHRLAREMKQESLPEAFVRTILTGWWTTCLEILPAKERAAGRY